MKILHVVPGLNQQWNGIAGSAKDIARWQGADTIDTKLFACGAGTLDAYDEVWVHSSWQLATLRSCWRILRARKPLVRMPHGTLSPICYRSKWLKKLAVRAIERWLYCHASRVVVTCEAEKLWCKKWGVRAPFQLLDLKRFYNLSKPIAQPYQCDPSQPIHLLFLGRQHPLKGINYLRRAVAELNAQFRATSPAKDRNNRFELQVVSDQFGQALEAIWDWTDMLVLPTLSENFGRVVAEALERGKPVITTDGAPAWANLSPNQGIYIKGFLEASDAERVRLLKSALMQYANSAQEESTTAVQS